MSPSQSALQTMSEVEAWSRLRSQSVGRLALSADGQPDIFPVNFLADERTILIRTADGHKLTMLEANAKVAFEADQLALALVWSVVVKGTARLLVDEVELERVRRAAFWTWPERETDRFVRIEPTEITGRQFARQGGTFGPAAGR